MGGVLPSRGRKLPWGLSEWPKQTKRTVRIEPKRGNPADTSTCSAASKSWHGLQQLHNTALE